jgi:hypothetical protein
LTVIGDRLPAREMSGEQAGVGLQITGRGIIRGTGRCLLHRKVSSDWGF